MSCAIAGSVLLSACFAPNHPASETEQGGASGDTGGGTSSDPTLATEPTGSEVTSSGGETSLGEQTSSSEGTTTGGGIETGEATSSSSSGEPFEPECGDELAGPGEFCFEEGASPHFQDFAVGFGVGEVNGDGHVDVLHVIPDQIQMMLGDGSGGLSAAVESTSVLTDDIASVTDLDGDGALDVVFVGSNESDIVAGVAHADGLVFVVGAETVNLSSTPLALRASSTIVGGGPGAAFLFDGQLVVRSVSDDGLGEISASSVLSGTYSLLEVGDMNGDAIDDVLVGRPSDVGVFPFVRRYFGGAGGVLVPDQQPLLEALGVGGQGLSAFGIGDFDGDGNADVALAVSNALVVGLGNGVSGFDSVDTIAAPEVVSQLLSVDLDGDGRDELLAVEPEVGGAGLRVWTALDGGGQQVLEFDPRFTLGEVATGDLNEDSVPDIVVRAGDGGGSISVLLSNP